MSTKEQALRQALQSVIDFVEGKPGATEPFDIARAALALPLSAEAVTGRANLEGLSDRLLAPHPAQRDELGYLSHPALPTADEDFRTDLLLSALGFDSAFVSMESQVDGDSPIQAAYEDGDGVSGWEPKAPEGEGWHLIDIWDTEDGAYALFIRKTPPKAPESRRRGSPPVAAPADGMVLAPHFRGYAALGAGEYLLSPCVENNTPCLVIHIATEADKTGRAVGERRDTAEPGKLIQPEVIAVRLDFLSERGLFALEDMLAEIRKDHFPAAATTTGEAAAPDAQPVSDNGAAEVARQRDALGQGIADAAQKAGIYNGEVALSGPMLLMLLDNLADAALSASQAHGNSEAVAWMPNDEALLAAAKAYLEKKGPGELRASFFLKGAHMVRDAFLADRAALASAQGDAAPAHPDAAGVSREDFAAKVAELERAKTLITEVYNMIPPLHSAVAHEVREKIEKRTGGWFAFGMNRDAASGTSQEGGA